MKILVTGFQPFGGESVNPAYEAVKLLPSTIAGAEIITVEVPVVFDKGASVMEETMEKYNPDVVLCIGQAGGRAGMAIEKVAINLREASIPDNDGNQPVDAKIREDGENAYFTNLPIKAMVENSRKNGIPTYISYTAGTYVCNDIMYILLHLINKKYNNVKGGFIHVPFAAEQVINKPNNVASMSVQNIAKGIEYSIEAIVLNDKDSNVAMGTTM